MRSLFSYLLLDMAHKNKFKEIYICMYISYLYIYRFNYLSIFYIYICLSVYLSPPYRSTTLVYLSSSNDCSCLFKNKIQGIYFFKSYIIHFHNVIKKGEREETKKLHRRKDSHRPIFLVNTSMLNFFRCINV